MRCHWNCSLVKTTNSTGTSATVRIGRNRVHRSRQKRISLASYRALELFVAAGIGDVREACLLEDRLGALSARRNGSRPPPASFCRRRAFARWRRRSPPLARPECSRLRSSDPPRTPKARARRSRAPRSKRPPTSPPPARSGRSSRGQGQRRARPRSIPSTSSPHTSPISVKRTRLSRGRRTISSGAQVARGCCLSSCQLLLPRPTKHDASRQSRSACSS